MWDPAIRYLPSGRPGFVLVVLVVLLCSCATPYRPGDTRGGYTDTQLSDTIYRVTFTGNYATDVQQAIDFALLRCTEIAIARGFEVISVVDADIVSSTLHVDRPPALGDVTGGSLRKWVSIRDEETIAHERPFVTLVIELLHAPGDAQFVFNSRDLQEEIVSDYGLSL